MTFYEIIMQNGIHVYIQKLLCMLTFDFGPNFSNCLLHVWKVDIKQMLWDELSNLN